MLKKNRIYGLLMHLYTLQFVLVRTTLVSENWSARRINPLLRNTALGTVLLKRVRKT